MGPERQQQTLQAIHQSDAEAVLGAPIPARWTCHGCNCDNGGLPAAFVKTNGGLAFLCFACLLNRDDRPHVADIRRITETRSS